MVSLPPVGSLVVYFQQGHNEQGIVEEQYLAKKDFNGFEVVHVRGVEKGGATVQVWNRFQFRRKITFGKNRHCEWRGDEQKGFCNPSSNNRL
ncbi:hypothetical protein L6452_20858 [Arctium lappa]|uniref:Uncharacterized protein n=1 Tax=Arctium lappa TaxID=4217 RepID=A0ACB9BD31_ARCLA|nr:hypothetical protein L6452_20858 [Arctium lappa]